MEDPGIKKDNNYSQFQTTNSIVHGGSAKKGLSSSAVFKNRSISYTHSPARVQSTEEETYGVLAGKGTQKTRADKVREITGLRNSVDYHETKKPFVAKELRPKPHKRQLLDGEETVF